LYVELSQVCITVFTLATYGRSLNTNTYIEM